MTVSLRPLDREDGVRVLAWRNSPAVAAYMYSDHKITANEHTLWLRRALSMQDRHFWIIVLDDAPVGLANLANIDQATQKCDWAFYLADPSTRGRGVGAQVEYIVLQHVFGQMGLNKLWCEVLIENEAVWRLHASFGFVREALFRQHVYKGGVFRDVVGLGLLAADWAFVRPACEDRLTAKGIDLAALRISP
jgi:UDP-4-amino-4,6-dideoxy-N-acetyl-beta-L-altrosamine N-acetyltransferase